MNNKIAAVKKVNVILSIKVNDDGDEDDDLLSGLNGWNIFERILTPAH